MRHCKRCVYPDTKPDLFFDSEGVCSACRGAEMKAATIDWASRRTQFEKLASWAKKEAVVRDNSHDCIVPVSGGKDSHFQTITALEFGLRPLCISFEPSVCTPIGRRNLDNLSHGLGVDVIQFRKADLAYRAMARHAFKVIGDHDWPNHVGIFTVPMQFAVRLNIPLILWGENSQLEYGGPTDSQSKDSLQRPWLEEFGGLLGLRVSDMEKKLGCYLPWYRYPKIPEDFRSVFLGYFFRWDARSQVEKVKRYGFSVSDGPCEGTYAVYENLDCAIVYVHDYMKYLKFGFSRTSDHASIDIRNGRLDRDAAVDLVNRFEGHYPSEETMGLFSNYIEMEKTQIDSVFDAFTNPALFTRNNHGLLARNGDGSPVKNFEVK